MTAKMEKKCQSCIYARDPICMKLIERIPILRKYLEKCVNKNYAYYKSKKKMLSKRYMKFNPK